MAEKTPVPGTPPRARSSGVMSAEAIAAELAKFGLPPKAPFGLSRTLGGDEAPHPEYAREDKEGLHPRENPGILPSVLHRIGNTPLVRCDRLAKNSGITCELLAKCEFFNAGGSVKDRIARRMVDAAEKAGKLKKGYSTIIEPTSGNTGIGLALAAAVKGYKCIIVLPEKMSKEKVDVLRALGAQIVRTPTSAAWDSPESHIGVSLRLQREIPGAIILDQYSNPGNPLAHYEGTAEEILEQCGGKLDVLVAGAGTGGTITGIAKKLKEKCPGVKVVGVDPYGSILAQPESLNQTDVTGYQIEGIGYDFIPKVLDRSLVDEWVKSNDKDSFLMARRMIREEGLLCGGSCGTAMNAAVEVAKTLGPGQRVVVVLPDSLRNYMTKYLSDEWMEEHDFIESVADPALAAEWWYKEPVSALPANFPMTLTPDVSCSDAVDILRTEGFDQMPVVDKEGGILGMVSEANLMAKMLRKQIKGGDSVEKCIYKQFKQVPVSATIGSVSRILDKHHFVLVVSQQRCYKGKGTVENKTTIFSIVTRIDVLNFITKAEGGAVSPPPAE